MGTIKGYPERQAGRKIGRPHNDNRQMLNGVLWIARSGAAWRDLPERYGAWSSVYRRFQEWAETGHKPQGCRRRHRTRGKGIGPDEGMWFLLFIDRRHDPGIRFQYFGCACAATLAQVKVNHLFYMSERAIQSSGMLTIRPKKDDIGRYMMALDERSP